jgi:hypothetical protein
MKLISLLATLVMGLYSDKQRNYPGARKQNKIGADTIVAQKVGNAKLCRNLVVVQFESIFVTEKLNYLRQSRRFIAGAPQRRW